MKTSSLRISALFLCCAASRSLCAQPDEVMNATVTSGAYPQGADWGDAAYEEVGVQQLALPAMAFANEGNMASAAAAPIQSLLPDDFNLQEGAAVKVCETAAGQFRADFAGMEFMDEEQKNAQPPMGPPARMAGRAGDRAKWFIHYPVAYRGVGLAKQSDVLSVVGAGGDVRYVRKRNLPKSVDSTTPTVTQEAALAAAKKDVADRYQQGDVDNTNPVLEVWVTPALEGRLSWTFVLSGRSLTEPFVYRYWVQAVGSPQILRSESEVYHTNSGVVSGNYWIGSPLGSAGSIPLPFLETARSGGGTRETGADGRYGYLTPIAGSVAIKGLLKGSFCECQNNGGTNLEVSGTGTTANPIDLNFGASNSSELAQVSAFYWTNFAHTLAAPILSASDLAKLPTRVNLAGSCNAFWNGSSINFFKEGGSCPNMAYADVVLHEYGHGIDAKKGGILDGGLSEGFGDAIGILGTRQSCLGRDFSGAGTCLRNAADIITWPPGPSEGVHSIGRRYAGFVWQLIQELEKRYSKDEAYDVATELVLAAAAGNPSSIPDAVKLSFVADDDDGTLRNGSPHFDELAKAADSRKIPRPAGAVQGTGRKGFVWANNATAASYTPSATYTYNSAGGAVSISRSATGNYQVKLAGLGGGGSPGGNVQVTAYGGGNPHCKVSSWSSSGEDFLVNVRCFNPAGGAADAQYTVMVNWP